MNGEAACALPVTILHARLTSSVALCGSRSSRYAQYHVACVMYSTTHVRIQEADMIMIQGTSKSRVVISLS